MYLYIYQIISQTPDFVCIFFVFYKKYTVSKGTPFETNDKKAGDRQF